MTQTVIVVGSGIAAIAFVVLTGYGCWCSLRQWWAERWCKREYRRMVVEDEAERRAWRQRGAIEIR